jgi:hypothetical protein
MEMHMIFIQPWIILVETIAQRLALLAGGEKQVLKQEAANVQNQLTKTSRIPLVGDKLW